MHHETSAPLLSVCKEVPIVMRHEYILLCYKALAYAEKVIYGPSSLLKSPLNSSQQSLLAILICILTMSVTSSFFSLPQKPSEWTQDTNYRFEFSGSYKFDSAADILEHLFPSLPGEFNVAEDVVAYKLYAHRSNVNVPGPRSDIELDQASVNTTLEPSSSSVQTQEHPEIVKWMDWENIDLKWSDTDGLEEAPVIDQAVQVL